MLESGQTVFDCKVVKPLSENGVFQSYLVDCPDSTSAKLFLLLPDPLLGQKQRQSFFDHADWLSSQSFPGVGSPLKAGEIDGQLACLYPFFQGISLTQILDEGLSVRQSAELIKKIAECLSAPHSAGIWHGNLSPDTIYIEDGSPYVADFSLGQLIRLDYHSGIDPLYTSPEQVRGETPGIASDIYSLGCVFYHLLIGQPPFCGEDAFDVAKQHLQGNFPSLPVELSLFQPLQDSLIKTAVEERCTVGELIDLLTQLIAHQDINQMHLLSSVADQESEKTVSEKPPSLLDEAMDGSEIAARIEARLKEHAVDFQESEPVDVPSGEESEMIDGFDQTIQGKKIGFWRFALILMLGVAIGSGLYFVLNKLTPFELPVVVEQKNETASVVTVDLDQGLKLWQEADFNGAEAEFKLIIAGHREDPRAYNNLAAFYAAQGSYEQARDFLEQALATNENYATVYRNLGLVYAEMARGSYGRALQLDKTQAYISLPVFSSHGVVNLGAATEDNVAMQEQHTDKVSTQIPLLETESPLVVAEVASTDVQLIVDEQHDQTEGVDLGESVQVEIEESEPPEQPVVEVKIEPLTEMKPVNAVTEISKQETAETFLRRWALAWSNQDVDAYLTFYADQFIPPGGRTRADWEDQRHSRLTGPKEIVVSLDSFKLIPQENGRQRVEVIQSYKSDVLADRTQKIFDLQLTEKSWEILRERSLGVIR